MRLYYLQEAAAVSLEGNGIEDIYKEKHLRNKKIIQPMELKGAVLKIDPATALAVAGALKLSENFQDGVRDKTGIIVGSRLGNHEIAKNYSDKVRRGAVSPALYSASGPNIMSGLAANACKCRGPSLAVLGGNARLGDLLILSCNYMSRKDAAQMIVGQVDITEDGGWGMGIFFLLSADPSDTIINCIKRREGGLLNNKPNTPSAGVNPFVIGKESLNSNVNNSIKTEDLNAVEKHSNYLSDALRSYMFMQEGTQEKVYLGSNLSSQIYLFRGGSNG